MMNASGRLTSAALLALAIAGCQTEDKSPQPNYVSLSSDRSVTVVAPSSTAKAASLVSAKSGPAVAENRYFVEFRARYALSYGHTYVIFGRLNDAGQPVNTEVAGLHPKSKSEVPYVLGHFVPVPSETGWSDGDLEEAYRSASWRVMLNEREYADVVGYIRKLQASSPVWQASVYNCNAFTGDIAAHMGYKVPSKYLRPQQFVTDLREMNTG
ncbi:MAG: hypothetical protein ABWZ57_08735 [Mesorhizobium sp.]